MTCSPTSSGPNMGLGKILGISTKHEGQHVAGKLEDQKKKQPRLPKSQQKNSK